MFITCSFYIYLIIYCIILSLTLSSSQIRKGKKTKTNFNNVFYFYLMYLKLLFKNVLEKSNRFFFFFPGGVYLFIYFGCFPC